MPIINLTLHGKAAKGDGTKIVCVNSDYVVRLVPNDCDSFLESPIKKLVVKIGSEYFESDFKSVTDDGRQYWQAEMPPVSNCKSIELGACGKLEANGTPEYSSEPATFECIKSIMCGAAVLHKDPELTSVYITSNGRHTAADHGADGFYEVDVNVAAAAIEQRTVALSMSSGNQTITPSVADRNMSQVTITKPLTLIPDNIREGVDIGGVIGNYRKTLVETEVFQDGEYAPPAGADGFSKVIVQVGTGNDHKLLRIGDSFTYDYDTSVNITIDVPGIIKYENDGDVIIFTAIGNGSCSVLLRDMDAEGKVVKTNHYAILVSTEADYLLPTEVETPRDMQAFLYEDALGAVLKYTGANNDGFVSGALYVVVEEED